MGLLNQTRRAIALCCYLATKSFGSGHMHKDIIDGFDFEETNIWMQLPIYIKLSSAAKIAERKAKARGVETISSKCVSEIMLPVSLPGCCRLVPRRHMARCLILAFISTAAEPAEAYVSANRRCRT